MKLPISWLKDFVNITEDVKTISDALVGIGFEVEDVIEYGNSFSDVVVGRIVDIKPHKNADKLKICQLDVGDKILQIVTGAGNVNVGDYVPVALDGAVLGDKTIKAEPLRGEMSYGMLCSGSELKIDEAFVDGASVNGILILKGEYRLGEDIATALELKDTVLDVSITANRPDCHSILGLSREVAAALKKELKLPSFDFSIVESERHIPNISVLSDACPAYTGVLITDIKIQKSPKWMQKRLFMCGINPINNIVDITNYVLLEIGQPLHAFDLDMLNGGIIVRKATKNEKIVALNGTEYTLDDDMTLICDMEKPLAIAGVMGGKYSGISDSTQTVFLESARFNRGSVRNTSHKLGLRSDSSIRFERGVDYYGVEFGRKRALCLMEQLGAGKVAAERGINENLLKEKTITTTAKKINSLLGITVPKRKIVEILRSLGMGIYDGKSLIANIPLYREDIDNYTDLAEEVIRFYGYDKLDETFMPTASVTVGGMTDKQKRIESIKDLLCSCGAYEIMTYSFTEDKVYDRLNLPKDDPRRNAIGILNPISEELSVMKTELVSGMLSVIATNLTRKNDNFRLFELARTYKGKLPLKALPVEIDTLCVGTVGSKEDFYELKAIFESILDMFKVEHKIVTSAEPYLHPGMCADIVVDGKIVGSFGKLHPSVGKNFGIKKSDIYIGELRCDVLLNAESTVARYKPLPKFPAVERDLAFVVAEDKQVGSIMQSIKETDRLIGEVELFDIYRGEQIEKGFKSVALKIRLVPSDKTLVDSEISEVMSEVIDKISTVFGAKVRE